MKQIKLVLFAVFLLVAFCGNAFSEEGKLKSFEKKLDSKPAVKTEQQKPDQDTPTNSTLGQTVQNSFIESLAGIFLVGAINMAQESDLNYVYKFLKKEENPALPTFRLEGNYQYVTGNIQVVGGRVEAGYLMGAIDAEYKRFYEKNPNDTMNIGNWHVMLRTLFSDFFQINLALGQKVIWGSSKHDGFELGFPLYLFFGKHFYWDVRPYWAFIGGHDVYDVSSGINFKYKLFGARAGYRVIDIEGDKLYGPEVGLFFQY